MKTVGEILTRFGVKNPVRCGDLKYVNLDCPDLAKNPIKRLCNAFNRRSKSLKVSYLPPISGDALIVPEDNSDSMRALVKKAKNQGMMTFVVQHGRAINRAGFIPLIADYLIYWHEDFNTLTFWGIPEEKLIAFRPEKPENLKLIKEVRHRAVLFLLPPSAGRHHGDYKKYTVEEIVGIVDEVLEVEPDLLVKPHPKFWEYLKPYMEGYNVVWYNAYDLIYSADRIYSMRGCTTIKDCEVLKKKVVEV